MQAFQNSSSPRDSDKKGAAHKALKRSPLKLIIALIIMIVIAGLTIVVALADPA